VCQKLTVIRRLRQVPKWFCLRKILAISCLLVIAIFLLRLHKIFVAALHRAKKKGIILTNFEALAQGWPKEGIFKGNLKRIISDEAVVLQALVQKLLHHRGRDKCDRQFHFLVFNSNVGLAPQQFSHRAVVREIGCDMAASNVTIYFNPKTLLSSSCLHWSVAHLVSGIDRRKNIFSERGLVIQQDVQAPVVVPELAVNVGTRFTLQDFVDNIFALDFVSGAKIDCRPGL
jgi:hypothetical protein